jgi:hypothetical protein
METETVFTKPSTVSYPEPERSNQYLQILFLKEIVTY